MMGCTMPAIVVSSVSSVNIGEGRYMPKCQERDRSEDSAACGQRALPIRR